MVPDESLPAQTLHSGVIAASFDDGVDAGVDAGAVTAAGRRDDGRVD